MGVLIPTTQMKKQRLRDGSGCQRSHGSLGVKRDLCSDLRRAGHTLLCPGARISRELLCSGGSPGTCWWFSKQGAEKVLGLSLGRSFAGAVGVA